MFMLGKTLYNNSDDNTMQLKRQFTCLISFDLCSALLAHFTGEKTRFRELSGLSHAPSINKNQCLKI